MTALCGIAMTFWQLFVFRMGMGIGGILNGPATYSDDGRLLSTRTSAESYCGNATRFHRRARHLPRTRCGRDPDAARYSERVDSGHRLRTSQLAARVHHRRRAGTGGRRTDDDRTGTAAPRPYGYSDESDAAARGHRLPGQNTGGSMHRSSSALPYRRSNLPARGPGNPSSFNAPTTGRRRRRA